MLPELERAYRNESYILDKEGQAARKKLKVKSKMGNLSLGNGAIHDMKSHPALAYSGEATLGRNSFRGSGLPGLVSPRADGGGAMGNNILSARNNKQQLFYSGTHSLNIALNSEQHRFFADGEFE